MLNEREYLVDLRRFLKILDEDASMAATLASFRLFMGKDNTWRRASEIYLDEPYLATGLGEYFALGGAYQLSPLADFYQSMKIDMMKIARFAEALGARTKLPYFKVKCGQNPQWQYLSSAPGSRYTSPIDRDFLFGSFASLVDRRSEKLSKLIWSTMCSLPNTDYGYDSTYHENPLRAAYRKNETGGAHFAHSQLVHQMRKAAWVPQRGSNFVKPADARSELLPGGFTFDADWPWIRAIQFGSNAALESQKAQAEFAAVIERRKKDQQAAESLGFKDADTARKFAAMPADEQERALAEFERRKSISLPDHAPVNAMRRRERILTNSANAPLRQTVERTRSVSIGRDEIKEEAKQYLRQQYTNADAEQICQACKDVLPFKLGDGSYYFEAVEILPELRQHYDQNYLCLCPNHAAMFKHANASRNTLKERITAQVENDLGIVLAENDATIYFTKTHLADLHTIIEADQNLKTAQVT